MAKSQPDVNEYLGKPWKEVDVTYNRRDLILYAMGIGCDEMNFIYEKSKDFAMFPTYPLVLAFKGDEQDVVSFPSKAMAETNVTPPLKNIKTGLDGERYLEVINPLPADGEHKFKLKSRLLGVQGKKKGASVESEQIIVDETGKEYIRMISGAFMMGATGVTNAGKSNSESIKVPDRAPDKVEESATTANQAQLYRLSGDFNPLHIDPNFAKMFGFKVPILHGLCSLGVACRAVMKAYGSSKPTSFKAIKLRFASPVLPGQTLVTKMWKEGSRVIFVTEVKETGKVVINNSFVDLQGECPAAKL